MSDADRRGALIFGAVGDEDRLAGVFDDRLRGADFAIVVVKDRAVLIDRRGADDRVVGLELAEEVDGRLADNAAVFVTSRVAETMPDPRQPCITARLARTPR